MLTRGRSKLEAERSGLDDVVEDVVRGGCNKRNAELIEKDLNKIGEWLEKYAELYDGAVEELPEEEREGASRDRDASYADFENWTRKARAKVWSHTQETPPKAHGPARSHLQRVPLHCFSGKAEDWPEFRRYFHELTADEQFSPAIMMAQIRDHLLTKEAKALIAGKTNPTRGTETRILPWSTSSTSWPVGYEQRRWL